MHVSKLFFTSLLSLPFLCACSESVEENASANMQISPEPEAVVSSETQNNTCVDEANITYLCGPINAEDILRIGDSQWLLASGMNGDLSGSGSNGSMHLINHEEKTYEVIFPADNAEITQDMTMFAACPGPITSDNISVHGLAIREKANATDQYRVYVTSHGAREAIEVFEIDATAKPVIKWVGCVPIPAISWTNSVTILADGGFYATQFMELEGPGIVDVVAGKITGHVFEWHPGEEVSIVPGSELSGANGIAISDDERWLYVAAYGSQEVVRFDTSVTPISKDIVSLSISPDNIRWSSDGTLYTAGNYYDVQCASEECGGWGVFEINPDNMSAELIGSSDGSSAMADASSALLVEDEIWIGTYLGDRLGILAKP